MIDLSSDRSQQVLAQTFVRVGQAKASRHVDGRATLLATGPDAQQANAFTKYLRSHHEARGLEVWTNDTRIYANKPRVYFIGKHGKAK